MGELPKAGNSAEDVVQKAHTAIMRGTERSNKGRRPQGQNLETKESCLHFARSAINSVIEALYRKRELLFVHETVHASGDDCEEHRTVMLTAALSPDVDVALVDLKRELFTRLRKIAPKRLAPLIHEWEDGFLWESKLPRHMNRHHREQLQKLANKVLREIAGDLAD